MRIPTQLEIFPTDSLKQFFNRLQKSWNLMCSAVNGNLSFGSFDPAQNAIPGNMIGQLVIVVTPGTPNVEFQVKHNLGYIPLGYLVIQRSSAAIVYNGTTAWNGQSIYLKSTIAGANLILFVLG